MSQFFNPFEGANKGGGGGGGTSDYNELSNKPKINSVPLTGNKSLEDLGIVNTVVDSELSTTSENPVQNKIVTQVINDKLDIDDAVGKNVTGTEYTIDGQTITAGAGAEIFNNYGANKAAGVMSHAEGSGTKAIGAMSHAEGATTNAIGDCSHTEGSGTRATGTNSHAEGTGTQAKGTASHAEGQRTIASGLYSHAEGGDTTASGKYSHAEGIHTIASGENQHIQGKYNIAQGDLNTEMAFIIGNGTSSQNRSNAFAIDWDGKIYQGNTNNGVNLADQQKEIDYAINTGAKNLLEYNGYGTGAENGVTYTINTDGTITVNGTPQGTSPSYIELKLNGNAANIARFCDGHHILSGCPVGGSDTAYRMYAARGVYSRFDYGNGVVLTDTTLTDVRLVIYISNGYTANNLVFKPMIRRAEITDSTYEPYAPTNRELYETKVSQKEALTAKVTLENAIDLDTIKTAGIYNGVNSAGWNAVHMPVANGGFSFSLMVIESGEFIIQIFKQLNGAGDPDIYIRKFYIWNTGWDSWYKFTGVPV